MFPYERMNKLDGIWELWFLSQKRYAAIKHKPSTKQELDDCQIPQLAATVPGNVELDFFRAGIIDDPLTADHIIQTREMENNHYWYTKRFLLDGEPSGEMALVFEGLDTFCEIFVNGNKVGEAANMLIPHLIPVDCLHQGENELMVHIFPTVIKAREYEYSLSSSALEYGYDGLFVRKAPYMFGWDIMPRMISAGIWKSVWLVQKKVLGFSQCYLYTKEIYGEGKEAHLIFFYELELGDSSYYECKVRVTMTINGQNHTVEQRVWGKAGKLFFILPKAKLWWPRGRGEQALYDVKAELVEGGRVVDQCCFQTGVRTASLLYHPKGEEDNGEFQFKINGEKIYLMGTNWVPLDVFPSRNQQRLSKAIALVEDIGCNAIRCWGGNVYESDEFYTLCDQKGILVWQDFSMACGVYPNNDEFIEQIRTEARSVIRRLRQHPSICLWAGDNECDAGIYYASDKNNNPKQNKLTRELLPQVIHEEDYTRTYLPSSPYLDETVYHHGMQKAVEEHLWGDRKFFKTDYYTKCQARFISEIGYHGCPSPRSIRKFIDAEYLWPFQDNSQWLYHASSPVADKNQPFGYRIELMETQIVNMFGSCPKNLQDFALCSQISQAEAMKLFIEQYRMQKWEKSGLIWWNILDGCPQFSDSVVDYYFIKKLAYYYIQTAQKPFLLAMTELGDGIGLYAVNDTRQTVNVIYQVYNLLGGTREICNGKATVQPDSILCLEKESFAKQPEAFYRIVWQIDSQENGTNHFYAGEYPVDLYDYLACAKECNLLQLKGFDQDIVCFEETVISDKLK